jgi:two-component system sensor histidine kinase UhpB
VRSELGDIQVARDLAPAVFRIVQEALTNVARHAGATAVTVGLRLERGQLVFEVRDDGVGLSATATRGEGSLGLLGMRERARRLGGSCEITRGSPAGTVVTVAIPLRFPADRQLDDLERGADPA